MAAVFAEFEKSMLQERVATGLARARAAGKVLAARAPREPPMSLFYGCARRVWPCRASAPSSTAAWAASSKSSARLDSPALRPRR